MSIKTVLLDLDGTLLPMDQDAFAKAYFKGLASKLAPHGYEPKLLVDSILAGTAAMVKNAGTNTNEKVFWDFFISQYGQKALDDKSVFENFYAQDFDDIKGVCGYNPAAKETVKKLKTNDIHVVLATNPIFPSVATEKRIRWAGIKPEDFELITTYENSRYCKPNLRYYEEILKQLNLSPEECLMVGNDVDEDMVAENLGINVFLLTDYLINKNKKNISNYNRGDFNKLLQFIEI